MSEAAENSKRELEIDQTAEAAEEQPAAKRAKTEADAAAADAEAAGAAKGDADMAEDAEGAAAEGEEAADGEAAAEDGDAAEEQAPAEPVKLGYRTFKSAEEASDYIAGILKRAKPGENLNEVCSLMIWSPFSGAFTIDCWHVVLLFIRQFACTLCTVPFAAWRVFIWLSHHSCSCQH
jgi:hypothetical protein